MCLKKAIIDLRGHLTLFCHVFFLTPLRMKRYFEPDSGKLACSQQALEMYRDPEKRNMFAHMHSFNIH